MAMFPGCMSDSVTSRNELTFARGVSVTVSAITTAASAAATAKTSQSARQLQETISTGARRRAMVPPDGM